MAPLALERPGPAYHAVGALGALLPAAQGSVQQEHPAILARLDQQIR